LITSELVRAELFVHQLQHISASNAIPLIQPHLSRESRLTSKGFQLFLSGTEEDHQTVLDIIKVIDIKLKEYFVEVKILNHKMDDHQFNSNKNDLDKKTNHAKIKRFRLDDNRNANNHFNLRMTENYQAFVSTGESFPENKVVSQYGHLLPSSGRTKISSGFYMLVQQNSTGSRTENKQITVRISAQQQQKVNSNQSINSSSTSTKYAGVKGKWILIASNAEQKEALSNKRYTPHSKSSKERWYYVRVSDASDVSLKDQR